MTKKPTDLFGFLSGFTLSLAKGLHEAQKLKHEGEKNSEILSPEDYLAKVAAAFGMKDFFSPHADFGFQPDERDHERARYGRDLWRETVREDERKAAKRTKVEFKKIEPEVQAILKRMTAKIHLEYHGLRKDLDASRSYYSSKSDLILLDVGQFPWIDDANAQVALGEFSRRSLVLATQLAALELKVASSCEVLVQAAATNFDPALTGAWTEQAAKIVSMHFRTYHISELQRVQSDLENRLLYLREKHADYKEPVLPIQFDPKRRLIEQFSFNFPITRGNIAAIALKLSADWDDTHAAYFSMTSSQAFALLKEWRKSPITDQIVDTVLDLLDRSTLAHGAQELGIDGILTRKFSMLRPTFSLGVFSSFAYCDELLDGFNLFLPELTNNQTDRLLDTLVLAAECHLGPLIVRTITNAVRDLQLPPLDHDLDASRKEHYAFLLARLETSAIASIGKVEDDRTTRSFNFWHLELLGKLHAAVNNGEPSQAMVAWNAHLSNRNQIRASIKSKISPFWSVLLDDLLDRPYVGDQQERETQDRLALAPIQQFQRSTRDNILFEVRALLAQNDRTSFTLASRADLMRSIRIPFQTFVQQRLSQLVKVLELSDIDLEMYFAPPPQLDDLGEFAELLAHIRENNDYLEKGPFGLALSTRNFTLAEAILGHWLARAPSSVITDALSSFDQNKLQIAEWDTVDEFLRDPKTAVIGMNFSAHAIADISAANQSVVLEINSYQRSVFPVAELTTEALQVYTRGTDSWQGDFTDIACGAEIVGLGSLLLSLSTFRKQVRSDWNSELRSAHQAVVLLAEAFVMLKVNMLIAQGLASRKFSRSVPVVVGTHDFSNIEAVVYKFP